MKLRCFCVTTMAEQTFKQQPKRHGEILEKPHHKLVKSTEANLIKIAMEMWYRGEIF